MLQVFEIIAVLILWQCMVSQGVMKCPGSTEDWLTASMALQCREPNYYHCLRDENGHITQQCLQRVWIQEGMCPELNTKALRIDVFQCKSSENNCPTTTYWSNAVYLYSACIQVRHTTSAIPFIPSTTPYNNATNTESSTRNTFYAIPLIIAAVVIALLSIIIVVVVYVVRRKKIKDEGSIEERSNLQEGGISMDDTSNNRKDADKRILILTILREPTDNRIIANKAKEALNEEVVFENDYKMWKKDHSKKIYVFQNWIQKEQKDCNKKLNATLSKILRDATNGTKFVLVFPMKIWTTNAKEKEYKALENWPLSVKKSIASST